MRQTKLGQDEKPCRDEEMHDQSHKLRIMAAHRKGVQRKEGNEFVEDPVVELLTVLDMELGQYCDIVNALHVQHRFLIDGDASSFVESNKRKDITVLRIKILEEARKAIISRLAQCFDISYKELTLKGLATLLDSPYRERCAAYRKEILSLIRELESLTESQACLTQYDLHYINGVLKIFASDYTADFIFKW